MAVLMRAGKARDFLNEHGRSVLVKIIGAKGSSPREEGAWMLVSKDSQMGTIGGGEMEFQAIAEARAILSGDILAGNESGKASIVASFVLGPELGQCCGGVVELEYSILTPALSQKFMDDLRKEDESQRQVIVFGAGHVGLALVHHLAPLPFHVILADTRPGQIEEARVEAMRSMGGNIECQTLSLPEQLVREARADTAFVIMTHDHALDFLIAHEALKRGDASYVGMIGSKTKKAKFASYLKQQGLDEDLRNSMVDALTCPVGCLPGEDIPLPDKRPQAIGLATAMEIFTLPKMPFGSICRAENP